MTTTAWTRIRLNRAFRFSRRVVKGAALHVDDRRIVVVVRDKAQVFTAYLSAVPKAASLAHPVLPGPSAQQILGVVSTPADAVSVEELQAVLAKQGVTLESPLRHLGRPKLLSKRERVFAAAQAAAGS